MATQPKVWGADNAAMSLPRPVYPGATYLITRRVSQRMYLLRPSRPVDQVVQYSIAVAARKYVVVLHAITVMSNHYHMVVTDPHGRLPDFERWCNSIIARALNAHYGRWENFWATEQPSNVRLLGAADVLAKMVYTLSNPVAAGLVSHGDKWPGIRLFSPGVRKIARPRGFFVEEGGLPDVVALELVAPPLALPSHEAYRLVLESVAAKEVELRDSFRRQGRSFLGASRVLAQKVSDSPVTVEPRRQLSPRVACRNTWQRVEVLQRCKVFLTEYRAAFQAWKSRIKGVLFPYGTFLVSQRFGAMVAAPS